MLGYFHLRAFLGAVTMGAALAVLGAVTTGAALAVLGAVTMGAALAVLDAVTIPPFYCDGRPRHCPRQAYRQYVL
eukprot:4935974-Pyramimonas_sp.AAC.2